MPLNCYGFTGRSSDLRGTLDVCIPATARGCPASRVGILPLASLCLAADVLGQIVPNRAFLIDLSERQTFRVEWNMHCGRLMSTKSGSDSSARGRFWARKLQLITLRVPRQLLTRQMHRLVQAWLTRGGEPSCFRVSNGPRNERTSGSQEFTASEVEKIRCFEKVSQDS